MKNIEETGKKLFRCIQISNSKYNIHNIKRINFHSMAVVRSRTIIIMVQFLNELQTANGIAIAGNGSNTKVIYVTLSNACAMQFYFDYYYSVSFTGYQWNCSLIASNIQRTFVDLEYCLENLFEYVLKSHTQSFFIELLLFYIFFVFLGWIIVLGKPQQAIFS